MAAYGSISPLYYPLCLRFRYTEEKIRSQFKDGAKTSMKKFVWIGLFSLVLLGVGVLCEALAQVPPQDTSGAILQNMTQMNELNRSAPYLSRPITQEDITGPSSDQPTINIEPGVLPSTQGVQGTILKPQDGSIIGPRTP
jgi:hypothetical protein